ncbi:MAG: HDOD domain-containing protein [Planctomycetaceae bacterium]|nr:HDOD domain-containing protein [Planctomycetaceae bacterium]
MTGLVMNNGRLMNKRKKDEQIDWSEIRLRYLPENAEDLLPDGWKLPILPQSVTNFLQHANEPNYDIRVLTRILEQDGNLTCELLKHVNSSAYGMRHKIATVRKALVTLGIRRCKMLLLTAAVHATIKKFNSHLFDLHQFWADSLERAKFAREVARVLRVDTELAYTGSMLQDFLIPVLAHNYVKKYVNYWNDRQSAVCDLPEFEISQFGVSHAQVGAICLRKWHVPDELVCAVLCHHMSYEDLQSQGLEDSHLHAVAASSLIPTSIIQHRNLAIPLSEWDQQDSSFDLFQIAERVDRDYATDVDAAPNRIQLAQRIEDCLASHLSAGLLRENLINRQFGSFVLEKCIGIGSSGSVFRARHTMMNRPAAVKVLNSEDHSPEDIARFEREVQMTSRLQHPHTISIYDFGRTPDGLFYYAMEYIDGISLKQLVQLHGPQPESRVIHILQQICSALEETHLAGMVHRDIKPENVLLSLRPRTGDHATLLDFGLVIDMQDQQKQKGQGIAGTPLYLAPEAIDSPNESRTASDLYAIGAVGYYLVTGQPLYTGNNAIDICLKQLTEIPPSPSDRLGRAISPDLENLLMRCLHKSPAQRPDSAQVLSRELASCVDAQQWSMDKACEWWRKNGSAETQACADEVCRRTDATVIIDMDSLCEEINAST